VHSVFASCLLLGGRSETIKTCGDTDILQADLRQIPNDLCLRQSAGDSTGPEIDIAAGIFREFHIECDIGEVKATTRLENPDNLTKRAVLLGH
jgi:hypothetical protein